MLELPPCRTEEQRALRPAGGPAPPRVCSWKPCGCLATCCCRGLHRRRRSAAPLNGPRPGWVGPGAHEQGRPYLETLHTQANPSPAHYSVSVPPHGTRAAPRERLAWLSAQPQRGAGRDRASGGQGPEPLPWRLLLGVTDPFLREGPFGFQKRFDGRFLVCNSNPHFIDVDRRWVGRRPRAVATLCQVSGTSSVSGPGLSAVHTWLIEASQPIRGTDTTVKPIL